jgi:hypothetical protein
MLSTVRIAPDARKHGIDDDDILHAVRNRMFQAIGNDDLAMFIGPARNATLLEIGVLDAHSDDPVVIHADKARDKFLR